jgi:hypothetical protein
MRTRTDKRNLWTPIAACSVAVFAAVLGWGCVVHEYNGPPPAAAGPAEGCGNQPNMAAALHGLRDARGWLDKAEHNKGGWRDRAIQATDNALKETNAGCAFADNH